MQEVRLTIRKRAFPSRGRVRLNIAHLSELEIKEGDHVDLVNEATGRAVTATVIADTMVQKGQIRVSEEDLSALGLADDADVLVRKTPPLQEKVKKTAGEVKSGAEKTAESFKKEARKASDTIGKAASKTAGDVKKAVKKVKGDDTL
jgi:formylmethanofuran dehydrogenase subunit D